MAIACIALQAQTQRMLKIYQHSGAIDTTSLSRIDSVTFGNNQTIFIMHLKADTIKMIAIDQIDSMFWPYKDGPAYQITQPTAGQIFHVGDSVTVKWNYIPSHAGDKAYFQMSINGGLNWKWLTNLVCYMMYRDSTMAGLPCYGGTNYVAWPYVVTDGKYVGAYKFKISNPMSMPDKMADVFNPVSDSVVIRIHDYVNTEQDVSPMFSIKP
jgi:hypothetical protein